MILTHELKTDAVYWDAAKCGDKTFELRRDDRGFQKGDLVGLIRQPYLNSPGRWPDIAASTLYRRIRWILTGGQQGISPGFVVLQLEEVVDDKV